MKKSAGKSLSAGPSGIRAAAQNDHAWDSRTMDGFSVHDHTPQVRRHVDRVGIDRARRDVFDAGFGHGPLAGATGNVFKDDPFFNPWAPGGTFNK